MTCRPNIAVVSLIIAIGIGNLITIAKDSSLAGLCNHLCTAIAIEVGHSEVDRVAWGDVWSRLYAPKECAVELICIKKSDVACTWVCVASRLCITGLITLVIVSIEQSLNHNLHLSIAVKVAHRTVIGFIGDS